MYVFSKRGAEGETLKMKIYEYHFKILSERPSKNVDLENRVRQRIFIYGLTYLNKFSAPARSISSLLISMLSLLRLDWSLPRHVAALGSEPWKKKLKIKFFFSQIYMCWIIKTCCFFKSTFSKNWSVTNKQ